MTKLLTSALLLSSVLFSLSSYAGDVVINNSELNIGSDILTINSQLSNFNHTNSSDDYVIFVRLNQINSNEEAQAFVMPSEFNGTATGSISPEPSCDGTSSPTVFFKKATLDTSTDISNSEVLVCNFTEGEVSAWSVFYSVINVVNGDRAESTQALQSLIDEPVEPPADVIEMAMKYSSLYISRRGRGYLRNFAKFDGIEAKKGETYDISVALNNNANGESASSTLKIKQRSKRWAYGFSRQRCRGANGPKAVVKFAVILFGKHRNLVYTRTQVCKFSKGASKADWSSEVMMKTGSGAEGSVEAGLNRFWDSRR